jgi:CubicO group peptidase (beta-lactamase class C family)
MPTRAAAPRLRSSGLGLVCLLALLGAGACGAPGGADGALSSTAPSSAAIELSSRRPRSEGAAHPRARVANANPLAEAVDALFTEAEANDTFSGSVVVVDAGKMVLEKAYGFADRGGKRKNAPGTRFRIGSLSKQFTASAILALAHDGKLALTDPVSRFFPEYPADNLVNDGVAVTVHHLISHTSGIANPRATPDFKSLVWRRPITPVEQIGWAKGSPLVRKPGTAFAYVNYNFLLAALIVEKVSGQAYETFLRRRFFEPLGMHDTGTVLPQAEAARAAVGYHAGATGQLVALADEASLEDPDVTYAFGSGQIYSTVQDLARWDRALNGDTVLPAASRKLLFAPNLHDYAYGWLVQKKENVTYEWHNGAISPLGFTSLMVRVPSKDRFVAYLSNMDMAFVMPFEAKTLALALK